MEFDSDEFCAKFHDILVADDDEMDKTKEVENFCEVLKSIGDNTSYAADAICSAIDTFGIVVSTERRQNIWRLAQTRSKHQVSGNDNNAARAKRALSKLIATWSLARVQHYQWSKMHYSFLEKLAKFARNHTWDIAVTEMNNAMRQRHLAAQHSAKSLKIGQSHGHRVSGQDYRLFPVVRSDLSSPACLEAVDETPFYDVRQDMYGLLVPFSHGTTLRNDIQVTRRKRKRCAETGPVRRCMGEHLRTHTDIGCGHDIQARGVISASGSERNACTRNIIKLFTGFTDNCLDESTLKRGCMAQRRWNTIGEREHHGLAGTSIDHDIAWLFRDENTLDLALRACFHWGVLERINQCSASSSSLLVLCEQNRRGLIDTQTPTDGLVFLCHVCPREAVLDLGFKTATNRLLPALTGWLEYASQESTCLDATLIPGLIETCVAVSKHAKLQHAELALKVAQRIYHERMPRFLHLDTLRATSFMQRNFTIEPHASEVSYMERQAFDSNESAQEQEARSRGLLCLSGAESAMMKGDYKAAKRFTAAAIKLDDHIPEAAGIQDLVRRRLTLEGRLFRYQGNFVEAEKVLRTCRDTCTVDGLHNALWHVTRHLADVCCEQGRPLEAIEILTEQITALDKRDRCNTTAYRRLLPPLANAFVLNGQHAAALELLDSIDNKLSCAAHLDSTDKLDHVRAKVAKTVLAYRRGEWVTAIQCSTECLATVHEYYPLAKGGFLAGRLMKYRIDACIALATKDTEESSSYKSGQEFFVTELNIDSMSDMEIRMRKDLERLWEMQLELPLAN